LKRLAPWASTGTAGNGKIPQNFNSRVGCHLASEIQSFCLGDVYYEFGCNCCFTPSATAGLATIPRCRWPPLAASYGTPWEYLPRPAETLEEDNRVQIKELIVGVPGLWMESLLQMQLESASWAKSIEKEAAT